MKRAVAVLALCLAQPASAQTPLTENPEILDGLITAGMVYELDRQCDDVRLRRLRGINFLTNLNNIAKSMGLTQDEIDAYFDVEKDRLEPVARQRLQAMGAVTGDAASHCAVAQAEIASGSAVGRLLR